MKKATCVAFVDLASTLWICLVHHSSCEKAPTNVAITGCSTVAVHIFGASLSEPHTSVTALRTCVCMLACLFACLDRPLTVNFKWAHSNISRRSIVHEACEGQWRPDCQSAASAIQSEDDRSWSTHGNLILICASTDNSRPLTGGTKIWTVVAWLPGSLQVGPCINGTHKRQKFSSWLQYKA